MANALENYEYLRMVSNASFDTMQFHSNGLYVRACKWLKICAIAVFFSRIIVLLYEISRISFVMLCIFRKNLFSPS